MVQAGTWWDEQAGSTGRLLRNAADPQGRYEAGLGSHPLVGGCMRYGRDRQARGGQWMNGPPPLTGPRQVYDAYVEQGASAVDVRDGTVAVSVMGAVNVSATTPDDKPYVVSVKRGSRQHGHLEPCVHAGTSAPWDGQALGWQALQPETLKAKPYIHVYIYNPTTCDAADVRGQRQLRQRRPGAAPGGGGGRLRRHGRDEVRCTRGCQAGGVGQAASATSPCLHACLDASAALNPAHVAWAERGRAGRGSHAQAQVGQPHACCLTIYISCGTPCFP